MCPMCRPTNSSAATALLGDVATDEWSRAVWRVTMMKSPREPALTTVDLGELDGFW